MTTTHTDADQALIDFTRSARLDLENASFSVASACEHGDPEYVNRAHLMQAMKAINDALSALRWVQP